MELEGTKVIVLVEEMFNERELIYPYYRLQEAGAHTVLVGSKAKAIYKSKVGLTVTADAAADKVKADDFDGIIIPGGYAPDHMRRNPAMVRLVRDMHQQDGVVAAICHAGWMLASAGILADKRVTSFFAIRDDLINAGANWLDDPVVVDGNLITSRTPDDLPHFMRAVIAALK